MRWAIGGLLIVACTCARSALACSNTPPAPYRPAHGPGTDRQPPDEPLLLEAPQVRRGRSGDAAHCSERASITFAVRSEDHGQPPWALGYEITLIKGSLPAILPPGPREAAELVWTETDLDLPAFEATLAIVAVDPAGNRSKPLVVTVSDGGFATPRNDRFTLAGAKKACAAGGPRACTWLGKHDPDDDEHAWYAKACEHGDGLACEILDDPWKSREAYDLGCRKGVVACNDQAWSWLRHDQPQLAQRAFLEACRRGLGEGCEHTSLLDADGRRQWQEASERLCHGGDARACELLGLADPDADRSERWLQASCSLGDLEACAAYGDRRLGRLAEATAEGAMMYRAICDYQPSQLACERAAWLEALASGEPLDDVLQALVSRANGPILAHLALHLTAAGRVDQARRYRAEACKRGYQPACVRGPDVRPSALMHRAGAAGPGLRIGDCRDALGR